MKTARMVRAAVPMLLWACGVSSCTSINGTPMRGSADCRYVPSVEDCQAVADRIEEFCLRTCVVRLCRYGRAVCNDDIQNECVRRIGEGEEGAVGGFVWEVEQTCEIPRDEVNWCQMPRSPMCQARMMVHELAHACGWHHLQGQGVPGNEGNVRCL